MKQVLITLPNDTLGGAEQYLKNISEYYLQKGYFVTICFLKKKEKGAWSYLLKYKNINIFYTKSSSELAGFLPFLKILWKKRKVHYDFIFTSHVHLTGIIGLFIKFNILKKNYFIGRESTSIFKRFKGLKLLIFKTQYFLGYGSLDLLICQTPFMKKQFVEALPNLSKKIKIKVLPNPIDLIAISENSNKSLDTQSFNNYIVSAGRLIPEKGFDLLIEAFYKIKQIQPDLDLVILGEGEKRRELELKIEEYNLTGSVFLPGFVKNVYPYFKQAKLCVVSSRIEGFPNVLLQMMSQNDKVVSTLCAGGIEDIPGIFKASPNNVDALEVAILEALESDTKNNRAVFDKLLSERSIENFVATIESHLQNA